MNRALTSAVALVLFACAPPPAAPPPNVLLVVVDTLRADHTGLGGHRLPTTPRLDAFAAERGVVFEAARSTAPWTKPSVASIFTGLDPRQHRVLQHVDALHSTYGTLARAFGEAGWQTHAVQSNPYLLSVFGFDAGFIDYEERLLSEDGAGTIATYDRSSGENVNARALAWLDARDAERPFFLYVHHYEPHHKYLAEEPAFLPPEDEGPDPARRELLAKASMDELVAATAELTPEDAAYLAARYDSEILFQDRLLGELLDGLLDGTVVAVTGDHGEEFLEHGDLSHHNDKLFDELLHVPLLVAAPGVPAARRSEAVSLVDLGRTLLDLAGLQQRAFPGRSFAALVTGGEPRGAPFEVVAHGYLAASRGEASARERECLVAGRYKLVRDLVSGALSLYDLETDPGERVDLAGDEPGRTSELAARLDGYLERRGGLGPEPPPEPDEIRRQREGWLAEHAAALKALGY